MNIPRQFYGVNYISKLVSNFQDGDIETCTQLPVNEIHDIVEIPLLKKTSYESGISGLELSKLLRRLMTTKACALDGFAVAKEGALICSGYRPPYSKEEPHITNSTCKTITAIGVMFAMAEGLLEVADKVLSFFPEYETLLTTKYVKQMTVEHLLTMTTTTKCSEVTSVVEQDWVKAFLLTDCQYEPGTKFIYNSMNTYMLAAILVKVTGMSLMEYLRTRLFEPLGINDVKWELCPKGIERGGWGMHLSLEGMLKIGIFLANNGAYNGEQLIEAIYIKRMKDIKVSQDVDALSTGYGYQLWHLPKGLYMLSGMYGQHVIIDEKNGLVVATNAHSDKMFPDSKLTRIILHSITGENFYKLNTKLKEKSAYKHFLEEFQIFCNGWDLPEDTKKGSLKAYRKQQEKQIVSERAKLQEIATALDGKRLHIDQANFKFFPYMMQGMYQCPPFAVTDVAFKGAANTVKMCFYKERSKKEKRELSEVNKLIVEAGNFHYHPQEISIGENKIPLCAKLFLSKDEDNNVVLQLDMVFPAAGFSRRIKFFLFEERISIECMEYPDMRAIIEQVIYGETTLAGNAIDLTGKVPEGLRVLMEHKVEPRVYGVWRK